MDLQDFAALYREYSGALTARLIRLCHGDFRLAEDAVLDAFRLAQVRWQNGGLPAEPRTWLAHAAHQNASDRLRRQSRYEGSLLAQAQLAANSGTDTSLWHDQLCLIFACCHPVLSREAQLVLTLRLVCGLSPDQIAQAFNVDLATVTERLARAKSKLKLAKVPYVVPDDAELDERLEAVLIVVQTMFNQGCGVTERVTSLRQQLCSEAIRLSGWLVAWLPRDVEAEAQLALMLLHQGLNLSRHAADGILGLFENRDRSHWQHAQIEPGLAHLDHALQQGARSVYALQATIAALHARASTVHDIDWRQVAQLHERLLQRTGGAMVALNHAAAVAMADGPARGLALMARLAGEPIMQGQHVFFAARADLLRRAGRLDEAIADYTAAAQLVNDEDVRRVLVGRIASVRQSLVADVI